MTDPFRFDHGVLVEAGTGGRPGDARVAGADEAGRGCLAGPLVAAAVVLDYARFPFRGLRGLTDSKLLSPAEREDLYGKILCAAARVVWVARSPGTIDQEGLHRCNLAALASALEALDGQYAVAIVDGFDLGRPELRTRAVIGGDYKSAAVAAASIVAKVVRDRLMHSLAPYHPEYGFEEHVGYGTERHRQALREHGPSPVHRLSFMGVGSLQLGLWDEWEDIGSPPALPAADASESPVQRASDQPIP